MTQALADAAGPVVAVSDWMRAVPDLIRSGCPSDFTVLGTDGFGLSDTRAAVRRHFRVDAESITVGTSPRSPGAARSGTTPSSAPRRSTGSTTPRRRARRPRTPASPEPRPPGRRRHADPVGGAASARPA